jgi:hypothetical protein
MYTRKLTKNWFSGAAGALIVLCLFSLLSCDFPQSLADAISGASKTMALDGNSLYHQSVEVSLEPGELEVTGEVRKPGKVKLSDFYKREIMVKESAPGPDGQVVFTGAYRYRGYSLFDLLHPFNQEKKNADLFRPAIDLYIVIENAAGETVVFSWSEIFHTLQSHQVLIATEMAPILPYRAEVEYPAGGRWKVVAGGDLFAWRILEDPVRITVRSFDERDYIIDRDLDPMFSPTVNLLTEDGQSLEVLPGESDEAMLSYRTSFYGMGMGHHGTPEFKGPALQSFTHRLIDPMDSNWNRHGLVCMAGADGYRAVFSYGELFNRADQLSAILSIPPDSMDGGYYRIFHPLDFYADRSVKSLAEIYFFHGK